MSYKIFFSCVNKRIVPFLYTALIVQDIREFEHSNSTSFCLKSFYRNLLKFIYACWKWWLLWKRIRNFREGIKTQDKKYEKLFKRKVTLRKVPLSVAQICVTQIKHCLFTPEQSFFVQSPFTQRCLLHIVFFYDCCRSNSKNLDRPIFILNALIVKKVVAKSVSGSR